MSLFKKLFSSGLVKNNKREHTWRPNRVQVRDLHNVRFVSKDSGELAIANVNSRGVGFIRPESLVLQVGQNLHGRFYVEGSEFDSQAIIRHLSAKVIGCEFQNSSQDLIRAIDNYFRVEILAMSLVLVQEKFLQPDPRGRVVWLTDSRQNEIYLVEDQNGIVDFHISFLGMYLEGQRGMATKAGWIVDDENLGAAKAKASALIRYDAASSVEIKQLGRLLVNNATDLDAEKKKQLLQLCW